MYAGEVLKRLFDVLAVHTHAMCRSGSRQSVHHVVLTRHAQTHAANALALIHNGKVFADRIFFVELRHVVIAFIRSAKCDDLRIRNALYGAHGVGVICIDDDAL